jgi:hypothetical protein
MKTTGLNFIEAVQAASGGKKIRRACWTRGEYVFFNDDNGVFVYGNGHTESLKALPRNILADDWEIVPEPPKTMTFMEAVVEIEAGKKVRRLAWRKDWHARRLTGVPDVAAIFGDSVISNPFTTDDYKATDWIAVEEENQ